LAFDLQKLLRDVFDPQPDDVALITTDLPHGALKDSADWQERRAMAEEWREGFKALGAQVQPLLTYEATGAHNADLPDTGTMKGQDMRIEEAIAKSSVIVALTEFSATAPLSAFVEDARGELRAASMPGVLRRMEQTALAADYGKVAERVAALADRLTRAEKAEVVFSTGHEMTFDLRYRQGRKDDGLCRAGQEHAIINLPSGEAFIVPYEGEQADQPSETQGAIPVDVDGETVVFHIQANIICDIQGDGSAADELRAYFDADAARRNVAELGLGCNDKAVVTGNVLEDEKAGFHWAYGRSEHLGGIMGPESFRDPSLIVHRDIVYAENSPISIRHITLHYPDGEEQIMRSNRYTLPPDFDPTDIEINYDPTEPMTEEEWPLED
jgi:leucyl aminopeptidase (aminopeptidase T)